jgi:hypothetical protein
MKKGSLRSAKGIFKDISKKSQYYRRVMEITKSSEKKWYRYSDKDNNLKDVSFKTKPNAKVQLSLKINGRWEPWLYVDKSSIENAGRGVYSERTFEVDDCVNVFMGRKLTREELNSKKFSEYAMTNIDPCDKKARKLHWYLLSHLINHGNYTVANVRFQRNMISHCIKRITPDMECLVDYQRPIFCKKCHEYRRQSGLLKWKRVETKVLKEGAIGFCRECKSATEKLVVRECKICHKKLCVDCYDKFQISV